MGRVFCCNGRVGYCIGRVSVNRRVSMVGVGVSGAKGMLLWQLVGGPSRYWSGGPLRYWLRRSVSYGIRRVFVIVG